MKEINQLITSKKQQVTESSDRTMTILGQASESQLETINWFFTKMAMIWGKQFQVTYPDDKTIKMAKIEWIENIVRYSNEELERAFRQVKELKIKGDKGADWPDVAFILRQCQRSKGGMWG